MIELPEAATLARQLNESVVGLHVLKCVVNHSKHGFAFYNRDTDSYNGLLTGKQITSADAFGGRVQLNIGDIRFQINDGLNLRLLKKDVLRPQKHQLLIELSDGSALVGTVQMYAGISALLPGEEGNFYVTVSQEKPSPLSDAFDRIYFDSLFDGIKPSLSAKALLATEQRIPGLGNGCLQDILWNARLHPKAKVMSLSDEQRGVLFDCVKGTLLQMKEGGGRDTEKTLYGESGRYQTILSCKTAAYTCPACGSPITRMAYLGGNVYFCPVCQKL